MPARIRSICRSGAVALPRCRPHKSPILRPRNQTRANRILPDIIFLRAKALVVSEPMLREIPLPANFQHSGRKLFPFPNHCPQRLPAWK